jgi:hypothetical protein
MLACVNLNRFARKSLFASALLLFTLIQFAAGADDGYSWQQVSTTDGNASAEFPITPTKKEITDPSGKTSGTYIHIYPKKLIRNKCKIS